MVCGMCPSGGHDLIWLDARQNHSDVRAILVVESACGVQHWTSRMCELRLTGIMDAACRVYFMGSLCSITVRREVRCLGARQTFRAIMYQTSCAGTSQSCSILPISATLDISSLRSFEKKTLCPQNVTIRRACKSLSPRKLVSKP